MTDGSVRIKISRLPGSDWKVPLPALATPGSAGADVRANLPIEVRTSGLTVARQGRVLVPLGFAVEIPSGHEAQIRSRSGLALKHGVAVLNSPGTVDSDYRGPVGVILINLGNENYTINHGERIAQIVIAPVVRVEFSQVPVAPNSERGSGGFGSTGYA